MNKINEAELPKIGYTCAYTPLPIIAAAGFSPYRILPMGDSPDHAGRMLHDNLCPHIKKVIDIVISKKVPDLEGMVFINSCDAMRRLADAWAEIEPDKKMMLLDLPATTDASASRFYASELERMAEELAAWSGSPIEHEDLVKGIENYNHLSRMLDTVNKKMRAGKLKGGSARMQSLYNYASTNPLPTGIEYASGIIEEAESDNRPGPLVPVFLFGNVMPDPEAFAMIEDCGALIAGDDFCTGSRMFEPVQGFRTGDNLFRILAHNIQKRPPCARTFSVSEPGKIARDVAENAVACNARGVIGHTLKFCDPYLARLPFIRDELKKQGIPFLLLEGDCTLRSVGQQRTRIEAFIEMLG